MLCPHCMGPVEEGQSFCTSCGGDLRYANGENLLPIGTRLIGSGGLRTYQIGAVRGQGGFGITYIAQELASQKRVAIKEYFPTRCSYRGGDRAAVLASTGQDDAFRGGLASFLDEAKMLAAHDDLPSVVRVIDYFQANNTAYLVMEYLDGVPLHEQMAKTGGRLSGRELIAKLPPLLRDLGRLHQSGVIHRDISPDNIMWMPDGTLKLLDFGCARSMENGKSMTVLLKHGFAPIEQYRTRGQGPFTDVYALAATIYYCVTGQVPPSAMDRLEQDTVQSPIALGADITVQQETALLWALSVQPKARPQTMDEFAAMLFKDAAVTPPAPPVQTTASSSSLLPANPPPLEKLKSLSKQAKLGIGAAALAVIVLIALIAGLSGKDSGDSTPSRRPVVSASPSPTASSRPLKPSGTPAPKEPARSVTSDGYVYEVVDGTSVTVVGFEGNGIVPLPDKIEGLPVTAIGDEALAGVPLDAVTLPSQLKSIGANAFRGCSGLTQVTASSYVTCEATSFSGCTALRFVQIKGDYSSFGWWGLPDSCRVFYEGMDLGAGALSGRGIVTGRAKELYGLTADGQCVLLDVPSNVVKLVLPERVTFSKSEAAVTWIDWRALDNAAADVEIVLAPETYFAYELVDKARWSADWQTFAYEWMTTCQAAKAINDARPVGAPPIQPNEAVMRAAVLRLSELFTAYGELRPDGTNGSTALNDIGVDWSYTQMAWGRNSKSAQDAHDLLISDSVDYLAFALDSGDYAGRYYTEIGVAVSSPDGQNFYRYLFGVLS